MRPDAPDAHIAPQRFARTLLAGPLGIELFAVLSRDFPDIRRTDCFYGAALAITDMSAALLAAEAEVDALRRQLVRAAA